MSDIDSTLLYWLRVELLVKAIFLGAVVLLVLAALLWLKGGR